MMCKIKRAVAFCVAAILILSQPAGSYAYPGFGDDTAVKNDYMSRYGWEQDKVDSESWTGIDGKEYERTNMLETSMYTDVKQTNNELALDLGIINSYSDGLGNLGGGASIVAVARQELEAGVTEVPLGSNHTKYHDAFGIVPCAWCALFICWCAEQCGYLASGLYNFSLSCVGIYNYMLSANGFNSFKVRTAKPFGGTNDVREGDLVFWYSDGVFGHIGLVSDVTDSTISIISGNAGSGEDRVSESTYNRNTASYPQLWNGYIVNMVYPQSGAEPIFNFLVNVMGTKVAGACGALANIEAESGFVTDINEYSGGGGYGLCQWTGSRRYELEEYCANCGYDVRTLEGQLQFLKYELENKSEYWSTHNYLMNVSESAGGAYDAGYEWCQNFERPLDNYGDVKRYRASVAQNTYWPIYENRVR